jgi:GNAT superfamily N-acetyltransferase
MDKPSLRIETLVGPDAIGPAVGDLARLRITVFRDWPYLYDGSLAYETEYLAAFARSGGAILIAAYDGDHMVGASTGLPMAHEHADFARPMAEAGHDIDTVYYCAESVLLAGWRGRGVYRRFFDGREAHARALGFATVAFCGVIRPDDHPARPADDAPLDPVWRHFGYSPLEGVQAQFSWTDVGDAQQSSKPMQMWVKAL